jgi:hypothetical protein
VSKTSNIGAGAGALLTADVAATLTDDDVVDVNIDVDDATAAIELVE